MALCTIRKPAMRIQALLGGRGRAYLHGNRKGREAMAGALDERRKGPR